MGFNIISYIYHYFDLITLSLDMMVVLVSMLVGFFFNNFLYFFPFLCVGGCGWVCVCVFNFA